MPNGEQALVVSSNSSWQHKLCRTIMLKVFASLPQGRMVIKERGVLVDTFGQKDSELHAEIDFQCLSVYKSLLFGGSVASGETFSEGLWTTPNLTNVIRVFARNLPLLDSWESKMEWLAFPIRKISHLANKNSASGAKKNIAAHYDLGNKLYTRFLDDTMMYSSAIYPSKNSTLAQAQNAKLKAICDKLQLTSYGCKVTTTTISEEQHQYTQNLINKEGLQDKITLLKEDYRLLEGKYDKLVSIEMIEAVGKEYLPTFFKKCSSLLKDEGLMVLQAITISDHRLESYSKSVDFIQKHIFPGGFLPSQLLINQHLKKHTDLMIRDLHDIGLDYARTLRDWHHKLLENKEPLAEDGYDDRFMNMWRYYFSYCEGGFLERTISTVQLVISKPAFSNSITR
jgi:cyclopropane-fatty-acyl-phospholipid synthase